MSDDVWERNYRNGRFNRYPYDLLVSAIFRKYSNISEKRTISVLDIGCGGGNNMIFLASEGFNVVGIDGAPTSLMITQEHFKEKGLIANLVHGDINYLPFNDNSFDCVIDRQTISFGNRSDSIKLIYSELLRILKNNGRYIGFLKSTDDTNICDGTEVEKNTYNNFPSGIYKNSGLVHFFSKQELISYLSGFIIEHFLIHKIESAYTTPDEFESLEIFIIAKKNNYNS